VIRGGTLAPAGEVSFEHNAESGDSKVKIATDLAKDPSPAEPHNQKKLVKNIFDNSPDNLKPIKKKDDKSELARKKEEDIKKDDAKYKKAREPKVSN
jgi:hypothetical protein